MQARIEKGDEQTSILELTNLINRFDLKENISLDEFETTFYNAIFQIEKKDKVEIIPRVKADSLNEIILKILFMADGDTPRFADINSPHFNVLIKVLSSFAEDIEIDPISRGKFALTLSHCYSLIIPQRGLPLDDPYIKGTVKWRNYVLDRPLGLGVPNPELYLESCEFMSGIYARRAESAFPGIPVDINNPYIKTALEYRYKGVELIKLNSKYGRHQTNSYYIQALREDEELYQPVVVEESKEDISSSLSYQKIQIEDDQSDSETVVLTTDLSDTDEFSMEQSDVDEPIFIMDMFEEEDDSIIQEESKDIQMEEDNCIDMEEDYVGQPSEPQKINLILRLRKTQEEQPNSKLLQPVKTENGLVKDMQMWKKSTKELNAEKNPDLSMECILKLRK